MSENPESVDRHDPDINNRFIDIFRQEDNVALARMFTVALPLNDDGKCGGVVPKPATPTVSAHPIPVVPADPDVISGVDKDGDQMRCSYVQGVTPEYNTDAAIIYRVTEGGFLMPIDRVPGFIAWLQSRVAKHKKGQL